ncbi:MAG: HAMP domain-containing histidine kinase [Thermoleophilia bacterium]|nr:HAMP domain-containing histidine kinase [Thermoleophilia bacterium]
MRHAIGIIGAVNLVLFAATAVVCVRQWLRDRSVIALWAALAFVSLGLVVCSDFLLPTDPATTVEKVSLRIAIALLLVFPYLLYRFAAAFAAGRPLAHFVDGLTTVLVLATGLLPDIPSEGESWPWWFVLYAVGFLVHWSVLLLLVAARLWRAGRLEASVARRRMQMLALGSTALAAALLLSVGAGDDHSWFALSVGLLGTLGAIGFLLGFSPPAALRLLWRRPEQTRMQSAVGELMGAATEHEVAARVLPPMAEMVGARGIALELPDGSVLAAHETGDGDGSGGDLRRFEFPYGTLVVRTSSFAPFFGGEERKLFQAVGSLMGLALDRTRLFAQERRAREALEQADELKSQFVALAAHELRSPVGAIYGISETIAGRSHQLTEEQLAELQGTLTTQIRRLRELVEQLLDLSRLDADAVTINPQRVRVRERLERIVHAVAPLDASRIGIEVDAGLEADVDVDALERIVSNLLANACRYGEPPVVVRAEQEDGILHVTVEDSGPGVPEEFVPQLFDRFARSASSAETVSGTGLGLAIARSYARAHQGEVEYRPAAPQGAAFELTLPSLAGA